jgi:hypothetical protein
MAYRYPPAPKKSNKTLLIALSAILGVCLVCSVIALGTGILTLLYNNFSTQVATSPETTPTLPPVSAVIAPTLTKEVIVQPVQPTENPPSTFPASGTYTENFDTRDGAWVEAATENYKVGYFKLGNYFISLLQPNATAYVQPPQHFQEPFSSVAVSVNVRPGLQDGSFGIMCGFQDAENHYAVEVSKDQYSVYKIVKGKLTYLTDPEWKPAVDIDKLDNNGYVNLAVGCMGSTIVVQINNFGEGIVMDDADSFPTGLVAIFASSGTTKGAESYNTILFDDFSLQVKP